MRGFLDMSGGNLLLRNNNIIVKTGDISLGGRLLVSQDVSINGNLFAKGTILFDPLSSTNILGTAIVNTINVGGIINQGTYSLSGGIIYIPTNPEAVMFLSQNISYTPGQLYSSTGTGVLALGNVALNGYTTTTVVLGDLQGYGNAYFSGNTFSAPNMKTINFGSAAIGAASASLSKLFVTSDVSVNGRLFVESDISMGGNLTVRGNLIVQNGAVINANIINTTINNYQLIISEDISLNGRLIASSDVSLNGNLYVRGKSFFNNDVSLNQRLFVTYDTSLNGNLSVTGKSFFNNDVSLNQRLFVTYDTSLNGNLSVTGKSFFNNDVSLNKRLFVTYDTSLNGNLYVASKSTFNGDISANGNVVIYGNLMVQQLQNTSIINTSINNYQLIVSEDISLNGRLLASSDVSLAGRLYVSGAATFVTAPIMSGANINTATIPQLSISGITSAIVNDTTAQTVGGIKTFTNTIISNSDISLNARLLASSDVSLAGRLYVSGAATFVTAPIMSGLNINTATIPQLSISGITSAIINDTTTQTVGGIKTFTNTMISNKIGRAHV
jgi:predicted acyltransferase (DUF342 family)